MKTLIWSVAWGEHRYMLQSLVKSIKDVNIKNDIIVFTDEPIKFCQREPLIKNIELDFKQYWKFHYIRAIKDLNYDLFVFIDSDHFFVRKPSITFSDVIGSDPWHSFLESPINSTETKRGDWWGVPNNIMVKIYKNFGVDQNIVYNSNGGFWMCRKDFIDHASNTGLLFREYQKPFNFNLPEEVAIAILGHLFSKDYSDRFHNHYLDYWASEWTGSLTDSLPSGGEWIFQEYMTHNRFNINPAIVHAMRSKKSLVDQGRKILADTN